MKNERTLMVIDGNNVTNRAYYATSHNKEYRELPRDRRGYYINAVKNVVQQLRGYLTRYVPTDLAFVFDEHDEESISFRKMLYSEYKGGRTEKPYPLQEQLETTKQVLERLGVAVFSDRDGWYEADDLIAGIIKQWNEAVGGQVYVVSNDKDLYQLLSPNVSQVMNKPGKEICYTDQDFKNEFGITPDKWTAAKSILGETGKTSDNIPGAKGVGPKCVFPLLTHFNTIEDIYENIGDLNSMGFGRYQKKLETHKESVLLSKTLVTLVGENLPALEALNVQQDLKYTINQEQKALIYKRLGLSNMPYSVQKSLF
ncbi:5'-3' exonuclease [Pontibacillus halophilus]|uniref:5'-3' exonuclease n=1 Tax=Pontibacillus halophilus TaxID=516704 RepID=UPI0004185FB2|nr:5'-3' exonuclease H3TH domain-containing protein [Pontibacillus halophilus]